MANTIIHTIRRQNRINAAKKVRRVIIQGCKVVVFGTAVYLCILAILGFGSL